ETQQPAQRCKLFTLAVDGLAELLEGRIALLPGRMLELCHRVRVQLMELAIAPPLIMAAGIKIRGSPHPRPLSRQWERGGVQRIGESVARHCLLCDHVKANAGNMAG